MRLFKHIHRHYMNTADQLRIQLDVDKPVIKGSTFLVPVSGVTRVVLNSISYARSLSDNVVAVYIGFDEEEIHKMEQKWAEWNPGVRLIVLRSRYRSVIKPLLRFIETVEWKTAATDHITIVIPQFITKHWWQNILHNQSSLLIRTFLVNQQGYCDYNGPVSFK